VTSGPGPDFLPPDSASEPGERSSPAPVPDDSPTSIQQPIDGTSRVERPHPLTPFIRGWIVMVAAVGWFAQDFFGQAQTKPDMRLNVGIALGLVAAIAVIAGLSGLATWLTTRFVADQAELRVESGWIVRRSNRIAYSRIQSVDVVQPLAARLFGLAEVRIDAGGEGATKLQFLTRARAGELRDYLMRRAHGQRTTIEASNAQAATNVMDDLAATDRVLIRVPPQDLIVGAVLSHELLFILLGFLVPAAVAFALSFAFAAVTGEAVPPMGVVFSLGLLLPMATAVFSFLSKRVIGQFNYTLAETSAGLRITRGLTSLTSQTVPARRIQSIRIAQPILWRFIGRFRLDIEVLGYGHQTSDEDGSGTSTILLPIGTQAMVDTALHAVWPGLRLDRIEFRPTPPRSRVLDPLTYGWLAYGLDEQVIVSRSGWLTRIQSIVPHARLQSVRVTQGPWERRLELANLECHTTGLLRVHGVHHLDAAEARRLVFDEADRAKLARSAEALVSEDAADAVPLPAPPPHTSLDSTAGPAS
jgi:putative membrane protein